jgi:hypothetical protein
MNIPDRWAAVEVALRLIEPDIDAASLEAAKARIDPDWHRQFYERVDQQNIPGYRPGAVAAGASQRHSRQQIQFLHEALRRTVPALRQIKPQAWTWLRLTAYSHGVTLPTDPDQNWQSMDPERPHNLVPSLVGQLEALLAAANELGRPRRGRPVGLMVERAVAGQCAAVFFDLRRKCPTTSHPDQRVATVDPYHVLVEAVFERWHLDHWEDRAKEAASELRAVILGR